MPGDEESEQLAGSIPMGRLGRCTELGGSCNSRSCRAPLSWPRSSRLTEQDIPALTQEVERWENSVGKSLSSRVVAEG